MAKPTGSRPSRLAAEGDSEQRGDPAQNARLEKLKVLPMVMEAQEEQKHELAKRSADSAGRAISP
jgi:hypothetical protein